MERKFDKFWNWTFGLWTVETLAATVIMMYAFIFVPENDKLQMYILFWMYLFFTIVTADLLMTSFLLSMSYLRAMKSY